MAIGRTFKEALQKGLRSLEIKKFGLESITTDPEVIYQRLRIPNAERIFYLGDAFRIGMDMEKIYALTKIDRWFLQNIKEIIELEIQILQKKDNLTKEMLSTAKQFGFSDRQLAGLLQKKEEEIKSK